jgi:hypothetical protein
MYCQSSGRLLLALDDSVMPAVPQTAKILLCNIAHWLK